MTECASCHATDGGTSNIRTSVFVFDGNVDKKEGIAAEIDSLHAALGEAILNYSGGVANAPVVYISSSYLYYFNDLNSN